MNASKKGAAYENAFKKELLRRGLHAMRVAGSKGRSDLVLSLIGWQCKSGRFSCAAAERLASKDGIIVVHRTEEKEFCEH